MPQIYSSLSVVQKNTDSFTDYVKNTYEDFINFIDEYYNSRNVVYQDLDFCNNLLDYYNVQNYKLSTLVEYTNTTSIVNKTDSTIYVLSTKGFPNAGFLQIDEEIIYYNSKTENSFNFCIRGASCTKLSNDSLIFLESVSYIHTISKCYSIGYTFLKSILTKVSNELLIGISEKINIDIPYNLLLPKIKDFYKTKGTEDSVKFLFKIIYNDVILKMKLKLRGFGAEINLNIVSGKVVSADIINGGTNYNHDTASAYANLYVISNSGGSGAKIKVEEISATGVITNISVVESGNNYANNNYVLIQEQDFKLGDIVRGEISNATGIVRYYNPDNNSLDLYTTTGKFQENEKLLIINRQVIIATIDTIDIVEVTPSITYPYNNTLVSSNSVNTNANIVYLEYSGNNIKLFKQNVLESYDINLTQKNLNNTYEKLFIDSVNLLYEDKNKVIISVETIGNTDHLYNSVCTKKILDNTSEIIVDSTIGFPLYDGLIYVNSEYVRYKNKTINSFYNLTRNININDNLTVYKDRTDIVELIGKYFNDNTYNLVNSVLTVSDIAYNCKLLNISDILCIVDGGSNFKKNKFTGVELVNNNINSVIINNLNTDTFPNLYMHDNCVYVTGDGLPNIINNNSRTYVKQPILRRFKNATL